MRRDAMKMTVNMLLAGALLATAATAARADEIVLKNGLPYQAVTITGVEDGVISFMLAGRRLSRPLGDVGVIKLNADPVFTQAEEQLNAGKFAEAKEGYARAAKTAAGGWKKTLIQYRLLAAAEAGGDTAVAVEQWLDLADAASGARGTLMLRPKALADKGSATNKSAIALLEKKVGQVQDDAYLKTVQRLLLDLYTHEGQLAKAQAMAAKLAGTVATGPATGQAPTHGNGNGEGSSSRRPLLPIKSAGPKLRLAELAHKNGKHDEAIGVLEPIARRLPPTEMPTGFYLLGAAQLAKAEAMKDDAAARPLYVSAGLNLMRVVAFFRASPEAPRALLLAGRVNEKIGNAQAAKAAYTEVVNRYGLAEAAKEAQKALDALVASPPDE